MNSELLDFQIISCNASYYIRDHFVDKKNIIKPPGFCCQKKGASATVKVSRRIVADAPIYSLSHCSDRNTF